MSSVVNEHCLQIYLPGVYIMRKILLLCVSASMLAIAIFTTTANAGQMDDMIKMCEAALEQPQNELMYKTCKNILTEIENNKTKNQFSCTCAWNTKMAVVQNGKLCQYRCDCECQGNRRKTEFEAIPALSQETEAGSSDSYICHGQELYGYHDTPNWKKTLIGNQFKINTDPSFISSHLLKAIDKAISCQ